MPKHPDPTPHKVGDHIRVSKKPMTLLGSLLVIGGHYKTPCILLFVLGITIMVFGLLPPIRFSTKIPTLHGAVRKPPNVAWSIVVRRWSIADQLESMGDHNSAVIVIGLLGHAQHLC